jgi:hypothetical protein
MSNFYKIGQFKKGLLIQFKILFRTLFRNYFIINRVSDYFIINRVSDL